jgi:hypothetical protein
MSNAEINLNCLKHYMFSGNHIMKLYIKEDASDKEIKRNTAVTNLPKKSKEIIDNFIVPKEKDTLFWCFYIIREGLNKYEMLGNKSFSEEKQQKIQIVETLRNHKEILKARKWKRNIIEADLVYNEKITLETFLCICEISNINIVVLKNRCVYTFISDVELVEDIHIVEFKDICFGYNVLSKEDNIKTFNKYCLKYWKVDNISKPLLGQSKYKIAHLHNICKKLDIQIIDHKGKKFKKVELYNSIKLKI